MREKNAESLPLYARLTAVLRRALPPRLPRASVRRCSTASFRPQLVLHAHRLGADRAARGRVREQLAQHPRVGGRAAVEHPVPRRARQVQGGHAGEDVWLPEAVPRQLRCFASASGLHAARDVRPLLASPAGHAGGARARARALQTSVTELVIPRQARLDAMLELLNRLSAVNRRAQLAQTPQNRCVGLVEPPVRCAGCLQSSRSGLRSQSSQAARKSGPRRRSRHACRCSSPREPLEPEITASALEPDSAPQVHLLAAPRRGALPSPAGSQRPRSRPK